MKARNVKQRPNQAQNTKQSHNKPEFIAKREKWSRFGYVTVLRTNKGRIKAWQKWSPKQPVKTIFLRYNQRVTHQGPNDTKTAQITHIKEYKNINKVVTKRPIKGEVGQIMRVFEAWKGKRKLILEGFSYLGDIGNYSRFKQMLEEAERSAWSLLPFSPDFWQEHIHKRRIIYFLKKPQPEGA